MALYGGYTLWEFGVIAKIVGFSNCVVGGLLILSAVSSNSNVPYNQVPQKVNPPGLISLKSVFGAILISGGITFLLNIQQSPVDLIVAIAMVVFGLGFIFISWIFK